MSDTPESSKPSALKATLWVLLSACCFGSVSPLTAMATSDGSALQTVQLWRYGTSALLLGIAAYRARQRDPVARAQRPVWLQPDITLLGGGAQFLVASLSLSALRYLPAATIGFLFYTYPAWVTVLSAIRGIEIVSKMKVLALVLALAGVAAMVGSPESGALSPIGVLLAISAAVVYAIYIPAMSVRQRHISPLSASHAVAVGGTLCFAVWCLTTGELWEWPSVRVLSLSVAMGALTALAFLGFLTGLAGLGPVRAAIMSTIEPVWTAVLGLLVLGQQLGIGTLFGGAGILAAVVILQRPSKPVPAHP